MAYNPEDIIRYVDDELSPAEKQQMEADMQQDTVLAAGISLYRELKGTLQQRLSGADGEAALRGTLSGMNDKYFRDEKRERDEKHGKDDRRGRDDKYGRDNKYEKDNKPARVIPMRRWLTGIAAAASVLVAIVLLWPSDGGYLDKFGATQMVSPAERGSANDSVMQQAAVYFNNKEFARALPLLNDAVRADSSNQEALLYRGVASLHTGAVDAARKDLSIIAAGGTLFRFEAMFYMALSYAQQRDKVTARAWLGRIPEGAPYAEKAKELDKKLQ